MDKLPLIKKEEPTPNRPLVQPKIIDITAVAVPSAMGQPMIITYGLGEDSKLYAWSGQDHCWMNN